MFLELDKCCLCIELKIGSLIIGYILLVANLIFTALIIIALATINSAVSLIRPSKDCDPEEAETVLKFSLVLLAFFWFLFFMILMNLIFTCRLLVGIHRNNRAYVRPFVIFNSIIIVLYIINFLYNLCMNPSSSYAAKNLVIIASSIYLLAVIRSFYIKMGDPTKTPPIVYNVVPTRTPIV